MTDAHQERGVSLERFVATYPRLYHMATVGAWPNIVRHGLLSTEAILDLCDIPIEERPAAEDGPRLEQVMYSHPIHGSFVVRDQKPLNAAKLERCLSDMTVGQWLSLLDSRVFFWPTETRVRTLLDARAYRGHDHLVIAVDTGELVARQLDDIELSPINSGSTAYAAQPRGSSTFRPLADYPFDERRRIRGKNHAVAEVTVRYAVPGIAEFVTGRWLANGATWSRLS